MKFLTPAKTVAAFAFVGYAVVVAFAAAPPTLRIPSAVVLSIAPVCMLTLTVDPHWPAILGLLGPLNAGVYALFALVALGVIVVLQDTFKIGLKE